MATYRSFKIIFISLTLLLHLSIAQLTGILSHSSEDPELLAVEIMNEACQHVSVLKHNTIFDASHPSMPFTITDEAGKRLPMAGTHAMYSGIGKADLLDLAPGEKFSRRLNLSEYIDINGPTSRLSMTFTVALPAAFQGLQNHDGSYEIHPDAIGGFTVLDDPTYPKQMRMGDTTKANLTSVSLRSEPLKVTLSPKTRRMLLAKRQMSIGSVTSTWNGIKIDTSSIGQCTPPEAHNLSDVVLYSSYLAVAAKTAAADYQGTTPFTYFFPNNAGAATTVINVMSKIVGAQLGQGSPVLASCADQYNLCVPQANGGSAQLGYSIFNTASSSGLSPITPKVVMCPGALELPDNIWPCSPGQAPGGISKAYVFLHELLHIDAISGIAATDPPRPNNIQNPTLMNGDVLAGKDTTTDAAALATFASWSWDFGFGGNPWYGGQCMQNWSQANFNLDTTVDPGSPASTV